MTKLYDITNWPKLGLDETDYPFIGTVDTAPDIRRVLDVGGRKFSVHVLSVNRETAGVRPMDTELNVPPEAGDYEKNIVCPYCGYVDRDSYERSDEDTVECQRCGGTIHYQRIVTIEYMTAPVKPPKPIRARWVEDT